MKETDIPPCKYCGRLVLLGPPCCYDKLYELYEQARSEVAWLRKIQGKQAKQIQELANQLGEQLDPHR